MLTALKLLLVALLEALIKQAPNFVAMWEREQARRAAVAKRKAHEKRIDDYIAEQNAKLGKGP
jgi:hypothetical protein